jgi:hypothetical protein
MSSKKLHTSATDLCTELPFSQSFFFLNSQQSHFQVPAMEPFFGTGADPGFNTQECTNKSLTNVPFSNTCKEDEVSPEVEAGVVARLMCLQP